MSYFWTHNTLLLVCLWQFVAARQFQYFHFISMLYSLGNNTLFAGSWPFSCQCFFSAIRSIGEWYVSSESKFEPALPLAILICKWNYFLGIKFDASKKILEWGRKIKQQRAMNVIKKWFLKSLGTWILLVLKWYGTTSMSRRSFVGCLIIKPTEPMVGCGVGGLYFCNDNLTGDQI